MPSVIENMGEDREDWRIWDQGQHVALPHGGPKVQPGAEGGLEVPASGTRVSHRHLSYFSFSFFFFF